MATAAKSYRPTERVREGRGGRLVRRTSNYRNPRLGRERGCTCAERIRAGSLPKNKGIRIDQESISFIITRQKKIVKINQNLSD